jgi:phosphoglycolate phosphatase
VTGENNATPGAAGKISIKQYTNIVWDWNGTLLDDLAASVETINRMLRRRTLPPITEQRYRELFGFPVRPYYEALGFDFLRDDWHAVSTEYVETYASLAGTVALTAGVAELLPAIRRAGTRQHVLSALQENLLEEMLERFGIRGIFDGVHGADNIHADGKIARGREMLARCPVRPEETLMIGDTLHDAEVAAALGFDALLYTGGHNSTERLQQQARIFHRMDHLLAALQ